MAEVPLFGRVAWIDLGAGTVTVDEVEEARFRAHLGGPGLALSYLLEAIPAGADPLGPENVLAFAPGLLAGLQVPGFPRFTVLARSPLTGALGKSEAGGYWGPELKKAGYAALFVRGRAAGPVYLWVSEHGIEIRPAAHIWGMEPKEAQQTVRTELGEARARTAVIGVAGENQVALAGISNDLSHFNGRNGLGAVMGSKNLKLIAVRATGDIAVADGEALRGLYRRASELAKSHPQARMLHELGTPAGMELNNVAGCLPTNNWQSAVFPEVDRIGAERLTAEFLTKRGGCYMCPVRCKRLVKVDTPSYTVDTEMGGPEYETLAAFGSNCGVSDMEVIIKANELCNRYTLDTISAGMTISFAMACFEAGILTLDDTGGLDLRFGNEEVILPLVDAVAHRSAGLGALLADGSAKAARIIGRGAEEHLLTVKGQEIPMHDPRVKTGLGLQFAIAPQGADHWHAQHDPFFATDTSPGTVEFAALGLGRSVSPRSLGPEKARMVVVTGHHMALYDDLGVCVFAGVARSMTPLDMLVDMVRAATGWDVDLQQLMRAGKRTSALYRLFNLRHGLTVADDTLPERFFAPFADGPLAETGAIDRAEFASAVRTCYSLSGWDPQTGIPTSETLRELGLEEFVRPSSEGVERAGRHS